jgi:hypothetical protein
MELINVPVVAKIILNFYQLTTLKVVEQNIENKLVVLDISIFG